MPESAFATLGLVELVDLDPVDGLEPLHHQLGYAFTRAHRIGVGRVGVDHDDFDLAPVAAVDGARSIESGQPVFGRQPRAGVHQTDETIGQRYCNATMARPPAGSITTSSTDTRSAPASPGLA